MGRRVQGVVYIRGKKFWIRFGIGRRQFREPADVETARDAQVVLHRRIAEESAKLGKTFNPKSIRVPTIGEAVIEWIAAESPEKFRQQRAVERFRDWYGAANLVTSINTQVCSQFLRHRSNSKKANNKTYAATTIANEGHRLSAFFRWLAANGYVNANPMRDAWRPRGRNVTPEPVNAADVQAVLAAIKGRPLEAFYMIAFFAGLRRTEITQLLWSDIDLKKSTITVRGGKTRSSYATLPLAPRLQKWLEERPRKDGHVVCSSDGEPFTPHAIMMKIRYWNSRHELQLPNPHRARHTFCHRLVEAGLPLHVVAKLMRHASTRLVEDRYGHYDAVDFGFAVKTVFGESKDTDQPCDTSAESNSRPRAARSSTAPGT